jgi:hypothetical protein
MQHRKDIFIMLSKTMKCCIKNCYHMLDPNNGVVSNPVCTTIKSKIINE